MFFPMNDNQMVVTMATAPGLQLWSHFNIIGHFFQISYFQQTLPQVRIWVLSDNYKEDGHQNGGRLMHPTKMRTKMAIPFPFAHVVTISIFNVHYFLFTVEHYVGPYVEFCQFNNVNFPSNWSLLLGAIGGAEKNEDFFSYSIEYRVKKGEFRVIKVEYRVIKVEYRVIKVEYRVIKSEYRVIKSEYRVIKSEYRVIKSEYRVIKSEYRVIKQNKKTIGCGTRSHT